MPIEDLYGVATQNTCFCTEINGDARAFLEVHSKISAGSKTVTILHLNWGKPLSSEKIEDSGEEKCWGWW